VLQFGRLIGGEANNSVETIGGCQILFEVANNTLMFTTQGSANSNGPVLNFYGCLIESISNGFSPFIRSSGAMRIIGCVADGPMGGRLYSPESELVDTRFSGNVSGGIAWSLGATFTRPINNVFFYQNNTAIKAFEGFTGTFTNVTFADSNTNIINSDGADSSLLFTFIDCTTFADNKITNTNGNYKQGKSINYTLTNSAGVGLTGVKVAVYDNAGAIQDGIKTSASGAVNTIKAVFFDRAHGSTSVNKAPFDIRIREYGYTYLGFQSAVSESIKQEVRLADNTTLASTEAQAAAITGISLNFATETVTITQDADTQKLYDFYQYQLAQTANMAYGEDLIRTGDSFNLDDWDMVVDGCTYTGDATTTNLITLPNGGVFNGQRTDANGTVAPLNVVSITGITAGSRIQIYNVTTATEVVNEIVSGTSYTATYSEGTGYSEDDTIRVRLTYVSGASAKSEFQGSAVAGASGWSLLVEQVDNTVYSSFGIDGSTITQFQADYLADQVDVVTGVNFNISQFYAWWVYNLSTEDGIRDFFGGIAALDEANFRINTGVLSLYLDNSTNTNIRQLDNRRFFRSDGAYPVLDPTTGGGGIDVVWRNQILIAETSVSGLTSQESLLLNDIANLATTTQLDSAVSGLATLSSISALNNISTADVLTQASAALTAYDAPTKAELDSAVSGLATRDELIVINDGIKDASLFIPHTDDL